MTPETMARRIAVSPYRSIAVSQYRQRCDYVQPDRQPARKGARVPVISPSHRDLLETPHTVAFATVGTDGQPQVTAIWAMLDGDVVRTSLYKGRQKYKNLLAHPRVTLFVIDPENPFRTLEVRATAEITDDPGLEFLQRLLHMYGSDLETFTGPTEERVVITLNRPARARSPRVCVPGRTTRSTAPAARISPGRSGSEDL